MRFRRTNVLNISIPSLYDISIIRGQVSFPGGNSDDTDDGPQHTALR